MSRVTRPVSIDGIEFDALIESTEGYEANVPSYPVEAGFEVSDAIILLPKTLNMRIFLTNTPVTWRHRNRPDLSRVESVLNRLEEVYFKRIPVTVITTDDTYHNMAIVSIELTKSKDTGTSREIPITFQEVPVVESRIVAIPASLGRGGDTGAPAGTANTASRTTTAPRNDGGNRGSVLHGLASGAGLLGR